MEPTGLGSSSATLDEALNEALNEAFRLRAYIHHAAIPPIIRAARRQPTMIRAIAVLLNLDPFAIVVLSLEAVELAGFVERILLVDCELVDVDVVDVAELVEEGVARMLAICFPCPFSQQVVLLGPQQ